MLEKQRLAIKLAFTNIGYTANNTASIMQQGAGAPYSIDQIKKDLANLEAQIISAKESIWKAELIEIMKEVNNGK